MGHLKGEFYEDVGFICNRGGPHTVPCGPGRAVEMSDGDGIVSVTLCLGRGSVKRKALGWGCSPAGRLLA